MNEMWELALLCATVGMLAVAVHWTARHCRRTGITVPDHATIVKVLTPSGVTGYVDTSISPEALRQMARQLEAAIDRGRVD